MPLLKFQVWQTELYTVKSLLFDASVFHRIELSTVAMFSTLRFPSAIKILPLQFEF